VELQFTTKLSLGLKNQNQHELVEQN